VRPARRHPGARRGPPGVRDTHGVLLTGPEGGRPVFVAGGQRPVDNQAAVRHLARHHGRLTRRYGPDRTFCLLPEVVDSEAYGPDVTEPVADVTRAALPAPQPQAGG
jgi:hypothetical protein